jgi:3-deoxy-D-manno-octulosonate 8-phosphate phosphatase (KDO 8-P phosphatase)
MLQERFRNIKTLVFDVDGVFTDCTIHVGDADVTRIYNVRDGYAINIALKNKLRIAIISGGKQESIRARLGGLGIKDIFLSVDTDKKLEVFKAYVAANNLKEDEVLYMGDDIPDLLLMQNSDVLSVCPADACTEVLAHCHYISPIVGGRGCVREIIETVLKAQDLWLKKF